MTQIYYSLAYDQITKHSNPQRLVYQCLLMPYSHKPGNGKKPNVFHWISIMKMWYIYTMEYDSTVNKEIMRFVNKGLNLENIILSDVTFLVK